eukprot:3655255-Prymnesium_polylepis.1
MHLCGGADAGISSRSSGRQSTSQSVCTRARPQSHLERQDHRQLRSDKRAVGDGLGDPIKRLDRAERVPMRHDRIAGAVPTILSETGIRAPANQPHLHRDRGSNPGGDTISQWRQP